MTEREGRKRIGSGEGEKERREIETVEKGGEGVKKGRNKKKGRE